MTIPLSIQTNHGATVSVNTMRRSSRDLLNSTGRLATGERVTSAAENSAGIARGNGMGGQLRGLKQALHNANQASNMMELAEGSLEDMSNIYIAMRELAVQASNDSLQDHERQYLDDAFQGYKRELNRIANTTMYNDTPLLTGTSGQNFTDSNGSGFSRFTYQIGMRNQVQDQFTFDVASAIHSSMAAVDIGTRDSARASMDTIDNVLEDHSENRALVASAMRRIEMSVDRINKGIEDLSNSVSTIKDTDMASESAEYSKSQVLQQSGLGMLAQANSSASVALSLLS